jgi:MAP/microtubule affinity-regulating kinase
MAAAKASAATAKRRHSLFAGSGAAPAAVTFTQATPGAKKGPVTKDEEGKEIIPSTFAGSMAVGARPKPVGAPSGLSALPDGDEEEDEDAAALIAQAQAEQAKRRGTTTAAPTPSSSSSSSSSSPTSSASTPSTPGPVSEGEEMPDQVKAQQDAAAAAAAYKNRRRTSVAATRDAQNTLATIMQQKQKVSETEAAAAGASAPGGPGAAPSGQKDVRIIRGMFNVSATSSKPPDVVLEEVSQLLRRKRIGFKRVEESYVLKCEYADKGLRFEVEICKLPRLEEVCFVNMKRISGETFVWKEFCTQFFSSMQL